MGGSVNSVSATAEKMVELGHEVTVFTTNSNGDVDLDVPVDQPVDVNGVAVWYFKRDEWIKRNLGFIPYLSQSVGFGYAPAMKAKLLELVPTMDIVHTQLPFNYPTVAAGRTARKLGKPLFMNQRGDYDPIRLAYRSAKKKAFLRLLEMPNLRYATGLVALTKREEESFRSLGLTNPVHIVPNGINAQLFRSESVEDIRAKYGWGSQDPIVLFLGRLHSVKGADKLLQAYIGVASQIPGARLIMAGPDDHKLEETFRAEVQQAGLAGHVVFPGSVTGEVKKDLLASADLFVLPSDAEGFSMAVLEAMASKSAVLLSPGCYFPESQTEGAGRICDPTVSELSKYLVEMVRDREGLAKMGERGLALVRERYTWDWVANKLVEVYSAALK